MTQVVTNSRPSPRHRLYPIRVNPSYKVHPQPARAERCARRPWHPAAPDAGNHRRGRAGADAGAGWVCYFYIATAAYYRLPIPVQPMKAVAAVLLTAHVTPAALAASGVMIGGVLLILGAAGWITRLA